MLEFIEEALGEVAFAAGQGGFATRAIHVGHRPADGPPTSNDAIALLRLAAEKGDVDNEYKLAHLLEQSGNYQPQSPGIAKPPKKIIRTPKMP
jgi:hypothetical protein